MCGFVLDGQDTVVCLFYVFDGRIGVVLGCAREPTVQQRRCTVCLAMPLLHEEYEGEVLLKQTSPDGLQSVLGAASLL